MLVCGFEDTKITEFRKATTNRLNQAEYHLYNFNYIFFFAEMDLNLFMRGFENFEGGE